MDAKQFLAEFGHIANAPGGISQLKEFILHLAVSGDLVSSESPVDAHYLLPLTIKSESTLKKKVVRKQASISRAVVRAPSHWAVCRLGDLASHHYWWWNTIQNQPWFIVGGNIRGRV